MRSSGSSTGLLIYSANYSTPADRPKWNTTAAVYSLSPALCVRDAGGKRTMLSQDGGQQMPGVQNPGISPAGALHSLHQGGDQDSTGCFPCARWAFGGAGAPPGTTPEPGRTDREAAVGRHHIFGWGFLKRANQTKVWMVSSVPTLRDSHWLLAAEKICVAVSTWCPECFAVRVGVHYTTDRSDVGAI